MIQLENVAVTYGSGRNAVEAVRGVSLDIGRGEVFGIVGSSGAGKSSLLRTINLLERPTSGHVRINGADITHSRGETLRGIRLRIGMIFQHFNLMRSKTIAGNVAFPLHVAGKATDAIGARIAELLDLVGLPEKRDAYPAQLSGGQKQRVGIARALANRPDILLCDEPTSALDLETTRSILQLLKRINTQFGITVVIISHEMDVVKSICDRVAVMDQGVLAEQGTAYDIFAAPRHPVTRQLVRNTLNLELPEQYRCGRGGVLFKLTYRGSGAVEPVLSNTARKFDVRLNILHGRIEYIGGKPLGAFIIEANGNSQPLREALAYLKQQTAGMEILEGDSAIVIDATQSHMPSEAEVAYVG